MTEKEFRKKSYKPFMEVYYVNERRMKIASPNAVTPCMLIAIDFDEGLFKLEPFPDTPYPDDRSFWAHYSHCSFNSDKLTVVS